MAQHPNSQAHGEGWDAYNAGKNDDDCPYQPEPGNIASLNYAWMDGFWEARDFDRRTPKLED